MPESIRSALYVDFDNIFSGLLELDREAALAFASDVPQWLERWRGYGLPEGKQRSLRVQRAYLNPNGQIQDSRLGNSNGLLYLQKFRPNLTQSGFEVIDCPAITRRQKNAADIRIVIDVMLALLEAKAPCDEVVVASTDSDFMPLLQLLRTRGFRVVVLAAGDTSAAYRAVADQVVEAEELIALLRGEQQTADDDGDLLPPSEPSSTLKELEPLDKITGERALERVRDLLRKSDGVLTVSQVGDSLLREFGQRILATNWFGHGSLQSFLDALPDENVEVLVPYVQDTDRQPDRLASALVTSDAAATHARPVIDDICRVTEMPQLPWRKWVELFQRLGEYATFPEFRLTECTAWVRDRLREEGKPVGRQIVGFVVKGALLGGASLKAEPPPSADEIREAFAESVIARAEAAGEPLDRNAIEFLRQHLSGYARQP